VVTKHRPTPKTVEDIRKAPFITYLAGYSRTATCRYCGATNWARGGLYKYSIRHYVCDACRKEILEESA
jgi:transposase-like protein